MANVLRRAGGEEQGDHADQQTHVTDPVGEERLEGGVGVVLFLPPVADQRESCRRRPAPRLVMNCTIRLADDQHQHRGGEQRQEGEEVGVADVAGHVVGGVDVHQQRDQGHDEAASSPRGRRRRCPTSNSIARPEPVHVCGWGHSRNSGATSACSSPPSAAASPSPSTAVASPSLAGSSSVVAAAKNKRGPAAAAGAAAECSSPSAPPDSVVASLVASASLCSVAAPWPAPASWTAGSIGRRHPRQDEHQPERGDAHLRALLRQALAEEQDAERTTANGISGNIHAFSSNQPAAALSSGPSAVSAASSVTTGRSSLHEARRLEIDGRAVAIDQQHDGQTDARPRRRRWR